MRRFQEKGTENRTGTVEKNAVDSLKEPEPFSLRALALPILFSNIVHAGVGVIQYFVYPIIPIVSNIL